MSMRDAVAQGIIRYNLDLDTLEVIRYNDAPWEPINFNELTLEDIQFLKANFNADMVDRVIKASQPD